MIVSLSARMVSAAVVRPLLFSITILTAALHAQTEPASSGQRLFEREWTANDSQAAFDGLGPLFNASSCLACHRLGGTGGAGTNENNVHILAVHWDRLDSESDRSRAVKVAQRVHENLVRAPAIVLHQSGLSDDYATWRLRAIGLKVDRGVLSEKDAKKLLVASTERLDASRGPTLFQQNRVPYVLTQRNTPALFGAGLIDRISDAAIRELAAEQRGKSMGISGRVPVANETSVDPNVPEQNAPPSEDDNPPVGRFGWKGQTSTLSEFVVSACANELGLQTGTHLQPTWPLSRAGEESSRPVDLTDAQTRALVSFVDQLPRPTRLARANLAAPPKDVFGEDVFAGIGCAHCHVPSLGGVDGIFSDLLLHDMGSALADPIPANPPVDPEKKTPRSVPMGYGMTQLVMAGETPSALIRELSREWRTPPLWGVADSAPYLHDGRAATLYDAIVLHDGEAQFVRERFQMLPAEGQQSVIAFLQTLVGPNR
jgi:CxxC motif-containing protein (DUF1111 family)